jgi:secreted trypsin-like serine protease
LHLSKSALEVSGVSAASLPTTDDATTGDDYPLRVGGWGKNMSSTSTLPQMLHQVNMVSVDQVKCNGLWKDVNAVTKNMICVQPDVPLAPGTSACNGDQGDPIVDETGQTVYGLVSWLTKDCSASPRPNVGSNFQDSSAKSWINGLTK